MSEMVERVARAICRGNLLFNDPDEADLDEKVDGWWGNHIDTARAAIEAMREPTVEMMDALDDGDEDGGLENGWRKAIDEALK